MKELDRLPRDIGPEGQSLRGAVGYDAFDGQIHLGRSDRIKPLRDERNAAKAVIELVIK